MGTVNSAKLPLTAPQNQREMLAAEIAYAALRTSRLAADDLRARAGLPPRNDGAPIGPIEQWKQIAEGARTAWLAAANEAISLVPQMRSAEQSKDSPPSLAFDLRDKANVLKTAMRPDLEEYRRWMLVAQVGEYLETLAARIEPQKDTALIPPGGSRFDALQTAQTDSYKEAVRGTQQALRPLSKDAYERAAQAAYSAIWANPRGDLFKQWAEDTHLHTASRDIAFAVLKSAGVEIEHEARG